MILGHFQKVLNVEKEHLNLLLGKEEINIVGTSTPLPILHSNSIQKLNSNSNSFDPIPFYGVPTIPIVEKSVGRRGTTPVDSRKVTKTFLQFNSKQPILLLILESESNSQEEHTFVPLIGWEETENIIRACLVGNLAFLFDKTPFRARVWSISIEKQFGTKILFKPIAVDTTAFLLKPFLISRRKETLMNVSFDRINTELILTFKKELLILGFGLDGPYWYVDPDKVIEILDLTTNARLIDSIITPKRVLLDATRLQNKDFLAYLYHDSTKRGFVAILDLKNLIQTEPFFLGMLSSGRFLEIGPGPLVSIFAAPKRALTLRYFNKTPEIVVEIDNVIYSKRVGMVNQESDGKITSTVWVPKALPTTENDMRLGWWSSVTGARKYRRTCPWELEEIDWKLISEFLSLYSIKSNTKWSGTFAGCLENFIKEPLNAYLGAFEAESSLESIDLIKDEYLDASVVLDVSIKDTRGRGSKEKLALFNILKLVWNRSERYENASVAKLSFSRKRFLSKALNLWPEAGALALESHFADHINWEHNEVGLYWAFWIRSQSRASESSLTMLQFGLRSLDKKILSQSLSKSLLLFLEDGVSGVPNPSRMKDAEDLLGEFVESVPDVIMNYAEENPQEEFVAKFAIKMAFESTMKGGLRISGKLLNGYLIKSRLTTELSKQAFKVKRLVDFQLSIADIAHKDNRSTLKTLRKLETKLIPTVYLQAVVIEKPELYGPVLVEVAKSMTNDMDLL